jgi:phospholipid transport system substrate-binding protein
MKKIFPALLLACAAAAAVPSSLPAEPGPRAEVQSTVDAIMALLQDEAISAEKRKEEISAMVRGRFDFRTMSQGVLATNWKKATGDEKERFTELFSKLLETTYRERIDAYNNERVEYLDEKIKGKKATVDTLVVTADVEIPVRYKMLNRGDGWLAYDVVVEGVSLVRNYRDSYRDIVKKEGMEGLLARMEEKIEELKTSPPGGASQ